MTSPTDLCLCGHLRRDHCQVEGMDDGCLLLACHCDHFRDEREPREPSIPTPERDE